MEKAVHMQAIKDSLLNDYKGGKLIVCGQVVVLNMDLDGCSCIK